LPLDEVIIEAMTSPDRPWDDLHHRSYFLPELRRIKVGEFTLTMNGDKAFLINPLAMHTIYVEGDMETISKMIPINISKIPDVMENILVGGDHSPEEIQIYTDLFRDFCDMLSWYYKEMSGIDPRIVEHEIMTYPDVKWVWQKLHLVNPRKATSIKAEVEKLLQASFIYLVQLTQWVSNPIPINKKQGRIHVCTDFCDFDKACQKDNFPTPFID
jgi:hypothetical protein